MVAQHGLIYDKLINLNKMAYNNCNKPIAGRINFESDFTINLYLPDEVGDKDFKIDFFTNPQRVVRFSRRNGELSTNLKDNGKGGFLAVFRRHGLQPGKLHSKAVYITDTNLSPDGEMIEVVPSCDQLELVRDAGDAGLEPEIELLAPFTILTAYDLAVKHGFAGTEEEWLESLKCTCNGTSAPADTYTKEEVDALLSHQAEALNALITQIQSGDTTDGIDSLDEIKSFLSGMNDTDTLADKLKDAGAMDEATVQQIATDIVEEAIKDIDGEITPTYDEESGKLTLS